MSCVCCWSFPSPSELLTECVAGDSSKGVFLCKHADVHLKAAALNGKQNCWLFMFLVSLFLQSLSSFVYMQVLDRLHGYWHWIASVKDVARSTMDEVHWRIDVSSFIFFSASATRMASGQRRASSIP